MTAIPTKRWLSHLLPSLLTGTRNAKATARGWAYYVDDSEPRPCYIKERLLADLAATINWIMAIEQGKSIASEAELVEAKQRREAVLRQIREHRAEHHC